jgi:hypothetical protein
MGTPFCRKSPQVKGSLCVELLILSLNRATASREKINVMA